MSEKLSPSQETSGGEKLDLSNENKENLERLEKAALEAAQETGEELGSLEKKAKSEAISGAEVTVGEREGGQNDSPAYSHKDLKTASYKRGLERIQSNLSTPERLFSKAIHNPVVDSVSNVTAKTVARPSGIFGGALITLIGSLGLTYLTRHYGFTYNYLFFMFLFALGYGLGILIEALASLVRRR